MTAVAIIWQAIFELVFLSWIVFVCWCLDSFGIFSWQGAGSLVLLMVLCNFDGRMSATRS